MVHIYGLYHDIQLIGGTLAEFWGPDVMVVLASASYFSLTFWIHRVHHLPVLRGYMTGRYTGGSKTDAIR